MANFEIMVSISCSTYNHRNFISDALDGFLMQKTNFAFEILIHDDASTDGTTDIIKSYQLKHSRIIKSFIQPENIHRKENKSELREPFVEARRGKYIAVCEGDDYWTDPLKLQKQVDFMEENPDYSMCFHKARVLDEDGLNRRVGLYEHLEARDYSGREILAKWTVPTASVLYRAELFPEVRKIKRHPDIMFGDVFLFLSLAELGKTRCINEEMSVYRIHGESITNKDNSLEHKMRFIKHQKALEQCFGGKYKHLNNDVIANTYLGITGDWVRARCYHKALNSFMQAVYYSPLKTIGRTFRKVAPIKR
jgi:glycosyltransferase involved in cell wall biosynthesis